MDWDRQDKKKTDNHERGAASRVAQIGHKDLDDSLPGRAFSGRVVRGYRRRNVGYAFCREHGSCEIGQTIDLGKVSVSFGRNEDARQAREPTCKEPLPLRRNRRMSSFPDAFVAVHDSAKRPSVSRYKQPVSHFVEAKAGSSLSSSSSSRLSSIWPTKTLESSRTSRRKGSAMLALIARGSSPVSSSSMGMIWLRPKSGTDDEQLEIRWDIRRAPGPEMACSYRRRNNALLLSAPARSDYSHPSSRPRR